MVRLIIDSCICVTFGIDNDIVYNEKKTMCMCIKSSIMNDLYVPKFHLGHLKIKVVEEETHIGNYTEDDHIIKEMRSIYAR